MDKPDWEGPEKLDPLREVVEVRQILGSGPAAGRSLSRLRDLKYNNKGAGGQLQGGPVTRKRQENTQRY